MSKMFVALPSHKSYVELFSGTRSGITKKLPVANETYNDSNEDVTNLFAIVRNDATRFVKYVIGEIESVPDDAYRKDKWVRAKELYVDFASNRIDAKLSKFKGFHEMTRKSSHALKEVSTELYDVMRRLRCVQYEGRRFDDILGRFDDKDTLFYVDVTRLPEDVSHEEVVYNLLKMKGKGILYGASGDAYEQLIDEGWFAVEDEPGTWVNYRV